MSKCSLHVPLWDQDSINHQRLFHTHRQRVLSTYRFPGRLGLENPCFCSCFGRNSSSIIDAVISVGLEASNCIGLDEHRDLNSNRALHTLTFFAISSSNSSPAARITPALADA